jgi:molybdopterin molybdotransferase
MSEQVLAYREAERVVLAEARKLLASDRMAQRVSLSSSAGRILAEAVHADRDQPPFPRATRDGFAWNAGSSGTGPHRVVGTVRAGEMWNGAPLAAGDAVEIMTGAAVPEGADAVAMVEHVERSGDEVRLQAGRTLTAGENVVPVGAEARSCDVVVPAGTRLGPAQIAAAAACGYAEVTVAAKARVAILATGDELVPVAETPAPAQIRNSNSYSLSAQLLAMGAEPVRLPIVPDDARATEEAIRAALACDLLVMTGGVSMGRFDYVEQALERVGAEFLFTGVKMQPGKPVVFGRARHEGEPRYFLGLPGNPVSTMVTFALFGAPMVAALMGEEPERWPRWTRGALTREVSVKPGLTRFLPAQIESSMDGVRVTPVMWQGSGDLASTARAEGFVVVPEEAERLEAGAKVTALLLG